MINKVITSAKAALRRLKSKKGQTLVEYALIVAAVGLVWVSTVNRHSLAIAGRYGSLSGQHGVPRVA